MKGIRRMLAVSIAALMMLSATSLVLADGNQSMPTQKGTNTPVFVQSDSSKLIVQNSAITVWFQGYKPVLHIFQRNASGINTGFTVAVRGVYELNSTNKPVAVLPMTRAFPEIESAGNGPLNYSSGVSVVYNNTTKMIDITFSLTANELKVMPYAVGTYNAQASDMMSWSNLIAGPASVQVVFHINATTAHVKFDLLVNQWTWLNSTSDKLALNAVVMGHQTVRDSSGQEPTNQGVTVSEPDGSNQAGSSVATAASQAPAVRGPEDSVSIVGQNFLKLGYVSWGKEANATYANKTTTAVNVTMTMFSHGFTEEDFNYTSLLFVFNTPAGWATNYSKLAYDPTIGLAFSSGSGLTPEVVVLGSAAGIVVALSAIGAVMMMRRKK